MFKVAKLEETPNTDDTIPHTYGGIDSLQQGIGNGELGHEADGDDNTTAGLFEPHHYRNVASIVDDDEVLVRPSGIHKFSSVHDVYDKSTEINFGGKLDSSEQQECDVSVIAQKMMTHFFSAQLFRNIVLATGAVETSSTTATNKPKHNTASHQGSEYVVPFHYQVQVNDLKIRRWFGHTQLTHAGFPVDTVSVVDVKVASVEHVTAYLYVSVFRG